MNQSQINRLRRKEIQGWQNTVRALWAAMCKDVGIPEDSKFVESSVLKASRYYQFYNQALKSLWKAQVEEVRCPDLKIV